MEKLLLSRTLGRLVILACVVALGAAPLWAQAPNPAGPEVPLAPPHAPVILGPFGIFVPGPFPVPPFAGTTIDFEGWAESTLITNQYTAMGVDFTQDDGGDPMIDNKSFLFAFESSSGVGVLTGSTNGGAPFPTVAGLVAVFSPEVSKAGAFMTDTGPLGNYTVTIFDSANVVIDTITLMPADFPTIPGFPSPDPACDASVPWDGTGCGVWVGFDTGTNNIAKIQFGPSAASGDAFAIDDLVFAAEGDVLEPKLDMIEVKLDELKPEVVDLKAEVVEILGQISVLQTQIADVKAEEVDIKAELVDLKAETADIKAEMVDLQVDLDFKIDFEFEQALLRCGCVPNLYLPDSLERALALVLAKIDAVAALSDPDVNDNIPKAACYASKAEEMKEAGRYKRACLALGTAVQLLDGHFLPSQSQTSSAKLCLKIVTCLQQ